MINITVKVDFTEFDKMASRLEASLNSATLNAIGAIAAKKQVKEKYAKRFNDQVDSNSQWQKAKRAAEGAIGKTPGFLTGTTFEAISAAADTDQGKVFLEGSWPQGSGEAGPFSWDASGFQANLREGYMIDIPSEPLATKHYGAPDDEILWMYLDEDDVAQVSAVYDKYLGQAVLNATKGT